MSAPNPLNAYVVMDTIWLGFHLGEAMNVLSWAINRPGLVKASQIVWRQINPETLTENVDAKSWLDHELRENNLYDTVAFLTSRTVSEFREQRVERSEFQVHCVTTVGLGNAERVGQRMMSQGESVGTINIAVATNLGLTEQARLEAMSIIVQARTAAILEQRLALPTGYATGTGTDCVALASPDGETRYAGLHTEFGEAVGRAVFDCVAEGARVWCTQKDAGQV